MMDADTPSKKAPLLDSMDESSMSLKVGDTVIELHPGEVDAVKDLIIKRSDGSSSGGKSGGDIKVVESGALLVDRSFDYNHFATKKTVGMLLLDVCLIATQSAQLKAVIQTSRNNQFAAFLILFLLVSLLLQIAVGVVLCLVGRTNLNTTNATKRKYIDKFNNICIALIMAITVVNVMVSTFGIANNPKYLIQQKVIDAAIKNPNNTLISFYHRK